jgi:hypothetical protein
MNGLMQRNKSRATRSPRRLGQPALCKEGHVIAGILHVRHSQRSHRGITEKGSKRYAAPEYQFPAEPPGQPPLAAASSKNESLTLGT